MPTESQMETLRVQLRQRKMQQESERASRTEGAKREVESSLINQEEEKKNIPFGADDAFNAFKHTEQGSAGEKAVESLVQGLDDTMRVAAGGLGNVVAGAMGSSTIPEEAARTEAARARLAARPGGGVIAPALEAGGQLGQALALPGAAFATPIKAAGTGGGLAMLDTLMGRLERGEPINEGLEQILDAGMAGSISGLGGYHVGKLAGNLLAKFASKDTSLTALAMKAAHENEKLRNAGAKAMDDSGVVIRRQAVAGFLRRMERDLGDYELSPRTAREGWRAMNILRDRVNKGEDITLRNFNELRKIIRDSLYSPTGALKNSVNNNDLKIVEHVEKGMKSFISDLPTRRTLVKSGNVSMGVRGWEDMNKYHQKMARTERVSELIANAENKAAKGEKAFEQALQDEFGSLFNSKTGRELLNREFTAPQRTILRKIAHGDLTRQTFERLDRLVGSTIIAPVFRAVQSTHGVVSGAESSRDLARRAISTVSETKLTRPSGGRLGTASSTLAVPGQD